MAGGKSDTPVPLQRDRDGGDCDGNRRKRPTCGGYAGARPEVGRLRPARAGLPSRPELPAIIQ